MRVFVLFLLYYIFNLLKEIKITYNLPAPAKFFKQDSGKIFCLEGTK